MEKNTIVIEVRGGMITDIHTNMTDEVNLVIVDWDNINQGDEMTDEQRNVMEQKPNLKQIY